MRIIISKELVKRRLGDWLKVLVLLLDEAVVVVLVVLALRYFKIQIPLPVTILLVLVVSTLVFIIHIAVIPSFHRKKVTGREGMIGLQGTVVKLLEPNGIVVVNGEHWTAKSVDNNIEIGDDVEIVAMHGLTLWVKRL